MRVRCPKCSSYNDHPDELGWRKVQCPVCFHEFVATKVLTEVLDATSKEKAAPAAPPLAPQAPGPGRILAIAASGVLVLTAALFARLWFAARGELHEVRSELTDLAGPAGTDGASNTTTEAAGRPAAGGVGQVKDKIEADRVLVKLQAAVIEELGKRIKILETKVERGERALAREKDAHGDTKGKVNDFLKENMALRRELDAWVREVEHLQRLIERSP